jgi:glycosyltransferase involved in cell wall biosynthesis
MSDQPTPPPETRPPAPPARVCVIIPVCNGAKYLAEAIQSVLAQTFTDYSILVIDDGSKDNSADIAAAFPGVHVIRQANAGVSAARNRALRETRGEYVVLLDSDDRLLPRALEIGVGLLDKRPDLGFVYGFHESIDGAGKTLHSGRTPVDKAGFLTLLAGDSLVPPASAVFRRAVFDSVGVFNTRLRISEDHELYLRTALVFPIHCHNQVVVQYRSHGGNVSTQSATRTLSGVLTAMKMRLPNIRGIPDREAAYRAGRKHWISLFGPGLSYDFVKNVKKRKLSLAAKSLVMLVTLYPQGIVGYAKDHIGRLRGRR